MNKTLLSMALISILGFTVNANANTVLVGLADTSYPTADHDFQDLTFSISGAALSVSTTTQDSWDTESGQSIPTGTIGQVDGVVKEISSDSFSATTATLTYEYGPLPSYGLPSPPASGYGNASNTNLIWVQDATHLTEASAIAAGHYFANYSGVVGTQAFVASVVGAKFTANSLSFNFNNDQTGGNYTNIINGLASYTPGVANNGAYLATAVPEPLTLVMLGLGLLGFGYSRRHVLSDIKGISA